MHIEVNMCKNVLKYLYNTKDTQAIQTNTRVVGTLRACWIGAMG